jgi:hypothetical protein
MAMASKAEVASNTKKLKDLRLMAHDRGAWDELAPRRDSTTDARLLKLLHLAGDDMDLAATALALYPRPGWLEELMAL